VLLAKVIPVFEPGEAGQGIEGVYGRKVGVGNFAEKAFEGRDAEGDAGSVKNRGIQLLEIIAAPVFSAAPLPFGFDEPEAFFDM
jgi:hypothetical protein